jgi:hypothetical protein
VAGTVAVAGSVGVVSLNDKTYATIVGGTGATTRVDAGGNTRVVAGDWTGVLKTWNVADAKLLVSADTNPLPVAERLNPSPKISAVPAGNAPDVPSRTTPLGPKFTDVLPVWASGVLTVTTPAPAETPSEKLTSVLPEIVELMLKLLMNPPPADAEAFERETGKFEKYFSEKPGKGS